MAYMAYMASFKKDSRMNKDSATEPESVLAPETLEHASYRNHLLVSRHEKGKWVGEIFKDNVRIAYCEASGQASSLQHLRNIVDDLIQDAIDERKNAIPSQAELSNAIQSCFSHLPDALKQFVEHIRIHHESLFNMEQLSKITGYKSTTDISLLLAQFARTVCDVVAYEPPAQIDGRDPYLAILLEVNENCPNTKNPITLALKQNFLQAIIAIKGPLA